MTKHVMIVLVDVLMIMKLIAVTMLLVAQYIYNKLAHKVDVTIMLAFCGIYVMMVVSIVLLVTQIHTALVQAAIQLAILAIVLAQTVIQIVMVQ
jgi:hypothetical protein